MANRAGEALLGQVLPLWQARLRAWASSGELVAAAREALRLPDTPAALRELVESWAAGDFSALPPIVLLPASSMPGAAGAYAISTGTIYLNADWLATASEDQAIAVLSEELGHHLDGLLNAVDTPHAA
jgi:Zn-dependent protease with chaperone function